MNSQQQLPHEALSFRGLGLAPKILDMLDARGLSTPTPIQRQAIPPALEGKDVIGIAQTGTGKTLAFGLPLIQRIIGGEAAALILVPTRELALQVDESIRSIGTRLGIKTAVLIGGASMQPQLRALRSNPHIVIATPGRLIDHLQGKTIRLHGVSTLVLDEADRMLDMGFLPQMRVILTAVPEERQTMLFSATLSRDIMTIAAKHMKVPTTIEIAPQGTLAEKVTQEIFIVPKSAKPALLENVLTRFRGSTLVFCRTKYGAKRINQHLQASGISAAEIHSNRSLSQRREALEGFKRGTYRVLVATDIAARGIDVSGIELVINYDLPSQSADYVHRIGRTARAGASGHAISFALPDERGEIRAIERLTKKPLPVSALPALPHQTALPQPPRFQRPQRNTRSGASRGNWSRRPRR